MFSGISTLIEIRRGNQIEKFNLFNSAQYLLFFPLLLAGPFVKPLELLNKIQTAAQIDPKNIEYDLYIICRGLFKKTLATLIQILFLTHNLYIHTTADTIMWSIALTTFIYADFSGYSDISIGICALLGVKIDENFRLPYTATSPSDFWRRWHISLNSWLRDYVYLPLVQLTLKYNSKNKKFAIDFLPRFYVFATMIMVGLWHEVSFVKCLYGAIASLPLVIPVKINFKKTKKYYAVAWLFTFTYIIVIQHILFSTTLFDLNTAIQSLFNFDGFASPKLTIKILFILMCLILSHIFDSFYIIQKIRKYFYLNSLITGIFFLIYLLLGRNGGVFVYSNI